MQQRPGSGTTASKDVPMDESQRRDNQTAAQGPAPSLLPTASGINLAGDAPQENASQQGVHGL